MPSPAELQKRLQMAHSESDDDLKEAIAKVTDPTSGRIQPSPEDDPRNQEEYAFRFQWTDARGKVWTGDFVNRILSVGEIVQKGVYQASLQGGMPSSSFSPNQLELNIALAHMAYSLIKRPDWAKDLRSLKDPNLVLEIFEEVYSHEAMFRRLESDSAPSKAPSQGVDQAD